MDSMTIRVTAMIGSDDSCEEGAHDDPCRSSRLLYHLLLLVGRNLISYGRMLVENTPRDVLHPDCVAYIKRRDHRNQSQGDQRRCPGTAFPDFGEHGCRIVKDLQKTAHLSNECNKVPRR
jgi:hypothetical protein